LSTIIEGKPLKLNLMLNTRTLALIAHILSTKNLNVFHQGLEHIMFDFGMNLSQFLMSRSTT